MKGRIVEKTAALVCALVLSVVVMSGAVFARGTASAAAGPSGEQPQSEAVLPVTENLAVTEVTDNRGQLPLLVNGIESGACPVLDGELWVEPSTLCRALSLAVDGSTTADSCVLRGPIELTANRGEPYFQFCGRYLPVEGGVRTLEGHVVLPMRTLAKCLGVTAVWDRAQWQVDVRGEAAPRTSAEVYVETDVYWLSRFIYAEASSRGLSLEGQIAVGDVILNRLNSDRYPGQNNVYDVIFAKNAFDVVINGMIYMEPDETSILAAKLALEGCDLVGHATRYSAGGSGAEGIRIDGLSFTEA